MNKTTDVMVVFVTAPNQNVANRLAKGLVEEERAACVSIIPGIQSVYRWQGNIEDESEWLLMIKTTCQGVAHVKDWVEANHGYDVPECIALPVADGLPAYLAWVAQQVVVE